MGTKLKAIFFAHDIKRKIVLVQMVEMLRIFSQPQPFCKPRVLVRFIDKVYFDG